MYVNDLITVFVVMLAGGVGLMLLIMPTILFAQRGYGRAAGFCLLVAASQLTVLLFLIFFPSWQGDLTLAIYALIVVTHSLMLVLALAVPNRPYRRAIEQALDEVRERLAMLELDDEDLSDSDGRGSV
jgi:hypothetical protein